MPATLTLWAYSLAALLFGALALAQWQRPGSGWPRAAFITASALTALHALAAAGIGFNDPAFIVTAMARRLGWIAFMLTLLGSGRAQQRAGDTAVRAIYAAVALVVVAAAVVGIAGQSAMGAVDLKALASVGAVLGMIAATGALVLGHHLYMAVAPGSRSGIQLAVAALALMWLADFAINSAVYLGLGSHDTLTMTRGAVLVALAPLFALGVHRNGDWTLRLSRSVTFQSLSALGIAAYLLILVLFTSALGGIGGGYARPLQTAFILGATTALATLVSNPWLRAWGRVTLAKHLFTHRYDYRSEWLRFTETLGQPGGGTPLAERVVKAVADMTESPAGLLLMPDAQGTGMAVRAAWNWTSEDLPAIAAGPELIEWLAASGRIVDVDTVRRGTADAAELAVVPQWILDHQESWVVVPLVHFAQLVGAVLLARPPVDRRPDWEDLDLLRIASRQVASYLAEANVQDALAEARRFDEFNRRFAFIMHDIKNLVSQLSLVARNAERHADNPAFRADMVATLKDSAARMNDLLARLSQHHVPRTGAAEAVTVMPLVEEAAARRRAQHPVIATGAPDVVALADPARLHQLLGHLVQNAIEASSPGEPVTLSVSTSGDRVVIDVIDRGCGMSAAFVRDQLFKPFVSSKPSGFGLGAFEARQLAEAMGGSVDVTSAEGEGTRFRVSLPDASNAILGEAA